MEDEFFVNFIRKQILVVKCPKCDRILEQEYEDSKDFTFWCVKCDTILHCDPLSEVSHISQLKQLQE
jgi:endogenous inhibitor of DNA gyrase (YacG/DUF329 family)